MCNKMAQLYLLILLAAHCINQAIANQHCNIQDRSQAHYITIRPHEFQTSHSQCTVSSAMHEACGVRKESTPIISGIGLQVIEVKTEGGEECLYNYGYMLDFNTNNGWKFVYQFSKWLTVKIAMTNGVERTELGEAGPQWVRRGDSDGEESFKHWKNLPGYVRFEGRKIVNRYFIQNDGHSPVDEDGEEYYATIHAKTVMTCTKPSCPKPESPEASTQVQMFGFVGNALPIEVEGKTNTVEMTKNPQSAKLRVHFMITDVQNKLHAAAQDENAEMVIVLYESRKRSLQLEIGKMNDKIRPIIFKGEYKNPKQVVDNGGNVQMDIELSKEQVKQIQFLRSSDPIKDEFFDYYGPSYYTSKPVTLAVTVCCKHYARTGKNEVPCRPYAYIPMDFTDLE